MRPESPPWDRSSDSNRGISSYRRLALGQRTERFGRSGIPQGTEWKAKVNRRAIWLLSAFFLAGFTACSSESRANSLRLGTTYTVEQSGALALLDSLHPAVAVRAVIGSSGQILHSAAAGDLDVVITHAPSLEQRLLIAPRHAALRCPFVASRFAVVGPASDPAGVRTARTAADAFHRIAATRASFISRGDSSGTHIKELSLWQAAGIAPPGKRDSWYVQTGVDQAATLRRAPRLCARRSPDVHSVDWCGPARAFRRRYRARQPLHVVRHSFGIRAVYGGAIQPLGAGGVAQPVARAATA